MSDTIELIPGNAGEPMFKTPEDYEEFRQWWYREVTPEMKKWEKKRAQSYHEFIFRNRL